MRASGQETSGQGNAEATITASVSGSDSQSVLSMETDMEVRGKAAQFGRGALGNVSQKILQQFARNLESQVLSGKEGEEPSEETTTAGGAEAIGTAPSRDAGAARQTARPVAAPGGEDSLDVFSVVGGPMLRQAAPAVAGLVLGLLIGNSIASRKTLRAYREAMRLMSYGQLYGPTDSSWRRPRR
jgi:hypothetical protein